MTHRSTMWPLADRLAILVIALAVAVCGAFILSSQRAGALNITGPNVSLSLDNSSQAASPAWTAVAPINITEVAADEIDAGQTNVTLVLQVPDGFEFQAGVGTVFASVFVADITSDSIAVTSSQITVTFTTDGTADAFDTILITGINARPTTTTTQTGAIHRPITGGGTAVISAITATDDGAGAGGTSFGTFTSVPGSPTSTLQVRTLDNNLTDGSGTPTTTLTAGVPFSVRVSALDQFGNVATSVTGGTVDVAFTTNAGNAPDGTAPTVTARSAQVTFSNGVGEQSDFVLTNAASARTITATVQNAGANGNLSAPANGATGDSSAATVQPGPVDTFIVQALDANSGGGSPTATVTAGTAFAVRATAYDQFDNLATSVTGGTVDLAFTTSAGNGPDGTAPTVTSRSGAITFTAGVGTQTGFVLTNASETPTITVTVQNAGGGNLADPVNGKTGVTGALTVNPGAAARLIVRTLNNNLTDGSGSPTTTLTAGTAFATRVSVGDLYENPVSGVNGDADVTFTSNAASAPSGTAPTIPSGQTPTFTNSVAEVAGFTLTNAASGQTITATIADAGTSGLTVGFTGTSPGATVAAGAATSTLLVEMLDNNLTDGSGTPTSTVTAGSAFSVRVTARDQFLNRATSVTGGTVDLVFTTNAGNAPDGTPPTVSARSAVITFTDGRGEQSGFVLTNVAAGRTITATVQNAGVGNLASPADASAGTTSGATVVPGAPAELVVQPLDNNLTNGSGSATTSLTAGTAFAVRVTSRDALENVTTQVTGGTVDLSFTTTAGNAPNGATPTVTGLTGAKTFTSGVVEIAGFTLPRAEAGVTVTATVQNAGGGNLALPANGITGSSAALTVSAGPSAVLVVQALDANNGAGSPTTSLTAGTSFAVRLTIADAFENPTTGINGAVDLLFSTNAANSPNGTAPTVTGRSGVATFTSGVAAVTDFVLTNATAGTTITATVVNAGVGGNENPPANGTTGTSSALTVAAGAAGGTLLVETLDSNTTGGAATTSLTAGIAFAVRVTVGDDFGNATSATNGQVDLAFSSNAGNAPNGAAPTIPASAITTFADGEAEVTGFVLRNATSGQTITATVQNAGGANLATPADGVTGTSAGATVRPGLLGRFVVEADGGGAIDSVQANTAFAIQITALDIFDNPSTSGPNAFSGAGNTVQLTSNTAGTTGLGTTPAFTNGVLTGHSVRLSEIAAAATLTATDTHPGGLGDGSQTGTSAPFAVTASSNAKLANVSLSAGAVPVSPGFSPNLTEYTATVTNAGTLKVSVTPDDPNPSSITIAGEPAPGGEREVPLTIGTNQIEIVVTAQDGVTTRTYTLTVTRAGTITSEPETGGGAPPTAGGTPTTTLPPVGVTVVVSNPQTTPVSPTSPTSVTSSGPRGSGGVEIPPGALPPASVVTVGGIADLASLSRQAPPPRTAQLLLGYAVAATNDGSRLGAGLFQPFTIRFTVNTVPAGTSTDNLFIAYWDGRAWTEIATTVTANADGTFGLVGSADRMAIYAVMYAPVRGDYDRPRPVAGTNPAVWLGGPLARAAAQTAATTSLWVYKAGKPYVYRVGGDPATNARFSGLFPQGVITMGTIVLVVRADGSIEAVTSVRELMVRLRDAEPAMADGRTAPPATNGATTTQETRGTADAPPASAPAGDRTEPAASATPAAAAPPHAVTATGTAGTLDAPAGSDGRSSPAAPEPLAWREVGAPARPGTAGADALVPVGPAPPAAGMALLLVIWLMAAAAGGLFWRGARRAEAHAAALRDWLTRDPD